MSCADCRYSAEDCAECKDTARAVGAANAAIRLAELERKVAALVAFVAAMPDGPVIT